MSTVMVDRLESITATILRLAWPFALVLALVGLAWCVMKFGVSAEAVGTLLCWAGLAALAAWLVLHSRIALAAALVVVARVGVFLLTEGAVPTTPDAHFYDSLARSLAGGRELPYVIDGVTFLAHAPRLHAYLLAIVYLVTDEAPFGPFILNSLLDGLAAMIIYVSGRKFGADTRVAALAAFAYFAWPHLMFNAVFAQKESLACLLIVSACHLLLRAWHEGRLAVVLYGIALGLLGFTQPAFFLLVGGLQLVLLPRLGALGLFRAIALTSLVATITLLPWIVRNWIFLGGFVPLTTGAGMSVYVNAAGTYLFPDQFNALPERIWSSRMLAQGLAIIAADPVAFASHQAKMMALGMGLEHSPAMLWESMQPKPAIRGAATVLLTQISLVGLWLLATRLAFQKQRETFFVLLFALVFAYISTVSIWFEFGARHRAYLLPMVLLWAAVAFRPPSGGTPRITST